METVFILSLTPHDVVVKKHYHSFNESSYNRLVSSLFKRARKEHCLIYVPDESVSEIGTPCKEIRLFYPKRDVDGNLYFEIVLHICFISQID